MFLQAVIGDWFGLVNGKMQIITTFKYVLDSKAVLFLICGARNERTIIKSKMQGPLQRGAEARSRSKRNKWGVARRGDLFMPDLRLNSLERSATGHGISGR